MVKHRAKIAAVALVFAAFGSEALTLGRVSGSALIGRPLDVPIQVQMDEGEDAASLCLDAEVFHADARQDASRVQVLVQADEQAHVVKVRVLSRSIVDEPVVTIYLRSGCGQKVTRRYVLLADLPSEVEPPAAAFLAPSSAVAQATIDSHPLVGTSEVTQQHETPSARPGLVAATRAREASLLRSKLSQPAVGKPKGAKAGAAQPKLKPSGPERVPAPPSGKPRLQLDPLESLSSRVATLETSTPATPPEDMLREVQRTQALERDVKSLLAMAKQNEANLADLKARLRDAEAQRFPAQVVYGLAVLVLVCLAAVALLWTRQRGLMQEGKHWWRGSPTLPESKRAQISPVSEVRPGPGQPEPSAAGAPSPKTDSSIPLEDPDSKSAFFVSQVDMSQSDFARLGASAVADSHSDKRSRSPPTIPMKGEHTQSGKCRFDSESVFDIRQQAEFFVSMGKTEQATQVLERQIYNSDEPNPFVYLDLLGIFYSFGLETEFREFRKEFCQLFNVNVPESASFKDDGKDLTLYPEVLLHVTALWPSPKVLEVIETCIFRDPWDNRSEAFDLAAFRDLLMLHAVAQAIGDSNAQEADKHRHLSSSGAAAGAGAGAPIPEPEDSQATPAGLIDLDLSDHGMNGRSEDTVAGEGMGSPVAISVKQPSTRR